MSLITTRLLTFILTLLTLRSVPTSDLFTPQYVRLELYRSFTIFLLVDPLKRAWLRTTTPEDRASSLNVMLVPCLVMPFVSVLVYALFFRSQEYKLPFAMYAVATTLELSAEPVVQLALASSNPLPKSRAESVAATAKNVYLLKAFRSGLTDLPSLALGQLTYSLFYFLSALATPIPAPSPYIPSALPSLKSRLPPLLKPAGHYASSSLFHHLLTELDRVLLSSSLSSPEVTTRHAIVTSYGGVIPRVVLSPMAELLTSDLHSTSDAGHRQGRLRSFASLAYFLAVVTSTYGPPNAPLLLRILKPNAHPDTATSLSSYMHYTSLLSLNGVAETYAHLLMTPSALSGGAGMVIKAVAGAAYVFGWTCGAGFVGAGAAGMAVRAAGAGIWITFRGGGWGEGVRVGNVVSGPITMVYEAFAFVAVRFGVVGGPEGLAFSVAVGVGYLVMLFVFERGKLEGVRGSRAQAATPKKNKK